MIVRAYEGQKTLPILFELWSQTGNYISYIYGIKFVLLKNLKYNAALPDSKSLRCLTQI